jgi:hypothetical protein
MTTRAATSDHWLVQLPGLRVSAALWGSLLAVDVGRLLSDSPLLPTTLVAVTVGLCSLRQHAAVVAAAGLIGWLVVTGFVVNADGVLAVSGAGDLGRLVLLLTCAAGGAALPLTGDR